MKNKIYLLYWLLAFLSGGCYDDKGNNDYRFVNTIEVEPFGQDSYPWAALGDTVRYKPVLHFASGNGDELDLAYEWTFAGKTIGDELNLEWIVDTVATGQVILRVTDRANGLVYSNQKSLRIDSPYKSKGWMILSEKNGQSSLGFVREMITAYEMDDLGIYCVFDNQTFPDVYEETNGEVLGSGPVRITEHFSRTAPGSLLILQQGAPGCIDIDGNTLLRDIYLSETFMDGVFPEQFEPVNATWMHWLDVIENKDGRLYTRLKYSDALFNSGYFITEPVLVGEEEVRGHLLDCDWQAVGYTVVHDRGTAANPRNRLAAVFDFRDFWGVNYAGYAAVFPEADKGWPDGFVPLNDLGDHELIYFRGWGDWSGGYYYMILKTPGGKYLQQTFTLKRSTAELYYEEGSLAVQELPSGFVYEDCLPYVLSTDKYLLLMKGNDMYYYNYASPGDGVSFYWHFDAPVKHMTASVQGQPQLGCALANGQFVILNVKLMKNRPEEKRLYWQTPAEVDLGNPVSLIYKTSGQL